MLIQLRTLGGPPLAQYESTAIPANGDAVHFDGRPGVLLVHGAHHHIVQGALEYVEVYVIPLVDALRSGQSELPLATPDPKG